MVGTSFTGADGVWDCYDAMRADPPCGGVHFDPALPGFHCYGIDLSLTARDLGLESYAIDAFVWHKYRDPEGYLVSRREDSEKILRRWSDKFMAEFLPSANYVESKWKKYLPFQTTSWNWDAP